MVQLKGVPTGPQRPVPRPQEERPERSDVQRLFGVGTEDIPNLREVLHQRHREEYAHLSPAERQQHFLKTVRPVTMALDLGSEREALDVIMKQMPDTRFERGPEGGIIAVLPDGTRAYVNRPGVSMQDVQSVATYGAMNAPFMAMGPMGWAGRAGTGAAIAGAETLGVNALLRRLGSEQPLTLGELGTVMGAAAAGEIVLPPVLRGVARALRGYRAGQPLTAQARAALERAGVDMDTVTPERLEALAVRMPDLSDPQAAIRQQEAHLIDPELQLTRGQATQSIEELQNEELLRNLDASAAGGAAVRQREQQGRQLTAAAQRMATEMGGGVERPLHQGGELVQQALAERRARTFGQGEDRGTIGRAYETAREASRASTDPPYIPGQYIDALSQRIEGTWNERAFRLPEGSLARQELDRLRSLSRERQGRPAATEWLALDDWVRGVRNVLRDTPKGSQDYIALDQARREYERWLTQAVREGVMRGDPGVIRAAQRADSLRAAARRVFEQEDIVQTLTDVADDGSRRLTVDPSQAANMIFGQSTFGSTRHLQRDIAKLRRVLRPEQWGQLRQEALNRLLRNQPADPKDFSGGKFRTALDNALRDHEAAMNMLFSATERQQLRRLRDVAVWITERPTGRSTIQPSRTALAGIQFLRGAMQRQGPVWGLIANVPVLREVIEGAATGTARRRSLTLPSPVQGAPVITQPMAQELREEE